MESLIDHSKDIVENHITQRIDQALHDVLQCQSYLQTHPIADQGNAQVFFDDARRALELSKHLSQNSYATGPFLANVSSELMRAKEGLMTKAD